jgi:hypothetical protein
MRWQQGKVARLRLWLLILVALLNSGGMGYWVCHNQVRSGSFWLKACSEGVKLPWTLEKFAPRCHPEHLSAIGCDCLFIGEDGLVPTGATLKISGVWQASQPFPTPQLETPILLGKAILPPYVAPPPQHRLVFHLSLRAPPAG